jgi:hypothetical protein
MEREGATLHSLTQLELKTNYVISSISSFPPPLAHGSVRPILESYTTVGVMSRPLLECEHVGLCQIMARKRNHQFGTGLSNIHLQSLASSLSFSRDPPATTPSRPSISMANANLSSSSHDSTAPPSYSSPAP